MHTIHLRCIYLTGDRIWEKGPFRVFLPFFKLSPFQGLKSPRPLAWLISSLDLLLHRSNVRSLSKPPVPSGEPPQWGIKRRFSNAIDALARPAHTGSGRGPRFAASVVIKKKKKIFFRATIFLYSPCPNLEGIKDALSYKFRRLTIGQNCCAVCTNEVARA